MYDVWKKEMGDPIDLTILIASLIDDIVILRRSEGKRKVNWNEFCSFQEKLERHQEYLQGILDRKENPHCLYMFENPLFNAVMKLYGVNRRDYNDPGRDGIPQYLREMKAGLDSVVNSLDYVERHPTTVPTPILHGVIEFCYQLSIEESLLENPLMPRLAA